MPDTTPSKPTTYFAPAERATPEELWRAISAMSNSPMMMAVLRTFGGILMVLNTQRQIIALNDELLRFLGCDDPEGMLGLRPGEALHCVHATDNPTGGCGTSPFCASCGAAVAIVASQKSGTPAEAECLLTTCTNAHEESFEFKVKASPVEVSGERFTVISLQDIRNAKRKEALESIFFHDILNTATALRTAGRYLSLCDDTERPEAIEAVTELTERLIQEISEQREMAKLEAGQVETRARYVSAAEVCTLTQRFFAGQPFAEGKTLSVQAAEAMLHTDATLLQRALTNLVKNALEATPAGGEVRVDCRAEDGRAVFAVWNAGAMAPNVAMRVFQRYFTTKGERGRGLGTYGAKLIVERYLDGSVSFTSAEPEGTTFRIELPCER